MSSIRFGSSIGPSGIAGSSQELVEQDGAAALDDADPNLMMQCPYDRSHQIRACRFTFHILKCAKSHPRLARELRTCPFNAKHLVPGHELAQHTERCKDKPLRSAEDDCSNRMNTKFHVPIKWTPPACREDWDEEVDDAAETFVWGEKNGLVTRPEPPDTHNPNAGVRAPRHVPWRS